MAETDQNVISAMQAMANICALIAEFRRGLIEQGLDDNTVLALTISFANSLWGNLLKPPPEIEHEAPDHFRGFKSFIDHSPAPRAQSQNKTYMAICTAPMYIFPKSQSQLSPTIEAHPKADTNTDNLILLQVYVF